MKRLVSVASESNENGEKKRGLGERKGSKLVVTMLSPYKCSRYWIHHHHCWLKAKCGVVITDVIMLWGITLLIVRYNMRCCNRCRQTYLFPAFSATLSSQRERGKGISLQRRLRFNSRWIRMECHSLLLPSLGTPPSFSTGWQNLSAAEGVFYGEDFDRPQTRHKCLFVSLSLSLSLSLCFPGCCRFFAHLKRHKVRLLVAPFHPVLKPPPFRYRVMQHDQSPAF